MKVFLFCLGGSCQYVASLTAEQAGTVFDAWALVTMGAALVAYDMLAQELRKDGEKK